jgi:hypothetical protein
MMVITALMKYVIPPDWSPMMIAAPIWVVSFFLAFALAEWAFRGAVPKKNTVALLIVNWLVVNLTLDILFAYYILGFAALAIKSTDHLVTYMIEIAAIFLAAYVTRRRHVHELMSEGIEL